MSDCNLSYNSFTSEVSYWQTTLGTGSCNVKLYELAFFKVFIKFELFLVDSFRSYSLGEKNFKGYTSLRKLCFENESHLDGMLKSSRTSFIDYFEKIKNQSSHIFEKDPFQLVFSDANMSPQIAKMQVIRNMIAHESKEAKMKYHNTVLGTQKPYQEPSVFLSVINRRHSMSNYSIQVQTMTTAIETLHEPESYFSEP